MGRLRKPSSRLGPPGNVGPGLRRPLAGQDSSVGRAPRAVGAAGCSHAQRYRPGPRSCLWQGRVEAAGLWRWRVRLGQVGAEAGHTRVVQPIPPEADSPPPPPFCADLDHGARSPNRRLRRGEPEGGGGPAAVDDEGRTAAIVTSVRARSVGHPHIRLAHLPAAPAQRWLPQAIACWAMGFRGPCHRRRCGVCAGHGLGSPSATGPVPGMRAAGAGTW